jgi:hypothetical protein
MPSFPAISASLHQQAAAAGTPPADVSADSAPKRVSKFKQSMQKQ